MLRRVAGLVMLGLGLWLGWGALEAILAFTSRGGDVASALFEPPTGIIRVISTALMTTAGGLMVAIPAYLAYMYFSSKSDRYLGEIEKLCQRVVDCISAESLEGGAATTTKSRKRRAA